jgi:hypothetical protein
MCCGLRDRDNLLPREGGVVAAQKMLERILRGTFDTNIPFDGLRSVLKILGFSERMRGSHHIFYKEGVEEILNLQPKGNRAKPYQVRQARHVILKYRLGAESDDEA